MSSRPPTAKRTKAVTVRVPASRLRSLLHARKLTSQSELINAILEEEEERLRARRVLEETSGAARRSDVDDRLL